MGAQVFFRLLLAAAGCLAQAVHAQTAEEASYPKGTNLTSVIVIRVSDLGGEAQQTLIATLQGLVARSSGEQIYVEGSGGYEFWEEVLRDRYGIPLRRETDPWALLDRFRGLLSGYILYDRTHPDSLNAATALSGPLNAVAVDRSIESQVRAHGLTRRAADVSNCDELWVWTRYPGRFNPRIAVEQKESFSLQLRDYAAMADAFTFFDGNSSFRRAALADLDPDARVFGWGDASSGEDRFVTVSSRLGVSTLAADWALNLSTLSSVRDSSIFQKTYAPPPMESEAHYVAFLATDGDNVQWNLGGLPAYFENSARGEFDMGWTISPSLAEVAPAALRWYYDRAACGTHRDFFVAGPSGDGYFYPSRYPREDLLRHVRRLDALMAKADLNLVQILDFDAFARTDLWDCYTAQPHIDGLLYMDYSRYDAARGATLFSNGKPVVAARAMLWGGLPGADEASLVQLLNTAPRDPSDPSAYTLAAVHVWSKTLQDVKKVVDALDPRVRVVTPDTLVKLLRINVGERRRFAFAAGLQGWRGGTSGKPYDKAEWTPSEGQGALLLDGSDLGAPDALPNAWFSRQLILPTNVTALRFATRAANDGRLRVRIRGQDGAWATLMDWDRPSGENWAVKTLDLSSYAGQTVTLCFEQNDGGQGSGEYRFVDDIIVETSGDGEPSAPQPPRLLEAFDAATNRVELLWRHAGNERVAFRVERKTGLEGAWEEIAALPASASGWNDTTVAPQTTYLYRVRALNASGRSALSNERAITSPALLIPLGARWQYWDKGSDPDPSWTQPQFDASAWPEGPAQLGYGDGDEAWKIGYGGDPAHKPITAYFRRVFEAPEPGRVTRLQGHLLRDDGAAVYLNGREIFRSNLPSGAINSQTRAIQAATGAEEEAFFPFAAPPTLLRPGLNVLAVEVHQAAPDSSDLSFDLDLYAALRPPQPSLQIARQGARLKLSWPLWAEGFQLVQTLDPAASREWNPWPGVPSAMENAVEAVVEPTSPQRFFRLKGP